MTRSAPMGWIFKVTEADTWAAAQAAGSLWAGAPVDLADGFIHFSTTAQLAETLRRHFAGQTNLVLIAFDPAEFGAALKWEPSRDGDLFPHLYAGLDCALAKQVWPLLLDEDGLHQLPEEAFI